MSAASPVPASTGRLAVVLGGLVALTIVGSSAVAVALPQLGAELELGVAQTAWVLAAFGITFSVATAVFGRIADLVGLRVPLLAGVGVLALGSLLAAAAPTFPLLLAGRLVQGVGAGSVPVLVNGIIAARFTTEQRVRVLAGVAVVVSVVSGSGPLIGGVVAEVASWRWVIAVPVVAVALLPAAAPLAPAEAAGGHRIDVRGATLVATAVAGLTVLVQGPAGGLPWAVLAAVAGVTLLAGAALWRHVHRTPHGFLPRVVVTNRRLLRVSLAGATLLASWLALLLGVPTVLADQQGWSPLLIGVALVPGAAFGAGVARMVGTRVGGRDRGQVAAVLAASTLVGLVIAGAGATRPALLVTGFGLVAAGFAGGQAVLLDAVPNLVHAEVRGVAIGLFTLIFFMGGAVGASVTGGLGATVGLPAAMLAMAALPALGLGLAAGATRSRPVCSA